MHLIVRNHYKPSSKEEPEARISPYKTQNNATKASKVRISMPIPFDDTTKIPYKVRKIYTKANVFCIFMLILWNE